MADWSIQMIRDILSSIEKCGNSLKHLAAGGKVALHYSFCVRIRGIEPGVGKVSATQHLLSKIRLTGQRLTIFKVKMAQRINTTHMDTQSSCLRLLCPALLYPLPNTHQIFRNIVFAVLLN